MIKDHDRSYYVGASDTAMILRSFGTKTFEAWYLEKMGLVQMCIRDRYDCTGKPPATIEFE